MGEPDDSLTDGASASRRVNGQRPRRPIGPSGHSRCEAALPCWGGGGGGGAEMKTEETGKKKIEPWRQVVVGER